MSETWSNGNSRTFIGSDTYYYEDKVIAYGNTPLLIKSNGNCMISGDADVLGHGNTFGDGP
jgi:hypothetical protein